MMLEVVDLSAGYGRLQVLYNVSFRADSREITAVVGPNGSGKSTLLKAIFGLTSIYSGKILYNKMDITRMPPHERARLGIAYLPQIDNVFASLTVEENLKMAGYLLDKRELKDRIDLAIEFFPALRKYMKRRAGTLSGGERQMLAIAMALVRNSKVLMLDEPTSQLAPKVAEQVLKTIVDLRDKLGLCVVLVEQHVRRALEISDRSYLLVGGRVVFFGKARELLENRDLGKIFLGLT